MRKSTIAACLLLLGGAVCCAAAAGMGVGNVTLANGIAAVRSGAGELTFDGFPHLRAFGRQEHTEDKALACGEVEHLVLDIDAAELSVRIGDSWHLSGGKSTTWNWDDGSNTLTVKQKQRGWWRHGRYAADIVLTMPEEAVDSVEITVDAGSVTVDGIEVKQSVQCSVDAGVVSLNNLTVGGALEADCDAGSINFSGQVHGPVTLDCDVGTIKAKLLSGSTIGRLTGSVDVGTASVSVNGKPYFSSDGVNKTIDIPLVNAKGQDVLTIDCDMGSISVDMYTTAAHRGN